MWLSIFDIRGMKMRRFIISCTLVIGAVIGGFRMYSGLYATAGKVIDVDHINDYVVVSINSDCFSFYGADGWENGDEAALLMFDHLTSDICDDMILKASYAGFIK